MKLKLGYSNSRRIINVMTVGLLLTVAILLGFASPVVASDPAFEFVLPAGLACDGFDLKITGWGEGPQVYKEFVDKNGNPVRTLWAGTGYALVYAKLDANKEPVATFSTKANGAVNSTTYNSDGTMAVTVTGHTLIILFPTDHPSGPSTKVYMGLVKYTVDPYGVYTLGKVAGRAIDICAALSK